MSKKQEIPIGDTVPDEVIAAQFTGERVPVPHTVVPDTNPDDEYDDAAEDEIRRLEAEIQESDRNVLSGTVGQMPDGDEPTLKDVMIMLAAALQQIAAGQVDSQRVATKALESAQRQVQPDNRFAPLISTLNPQGDLQFPKPKLKCRMDIPWEAEDDSCTYEEVELLNLLEAGDFVIKRNDNSKVGVTVRVIMNYDGKPSRLFMNSETAFTEESHWRMPTLVSILRQILGSRPNTKALAARVLTMDERFEKVASGELSVSQGVR